MSSIGSLLLSAQALLAWGTVSLEPSSGDEEIAAIDGSADSPPNPEELEPEAPVGAEPEMPVPEAPPDEPEEPDESASEALVHLGRAQDLRAAGDLDSAEAEVSVAISLQPDDAAAYLERAQIRVAMADQAGSDDAAHRRAHAGLLRQAAQDVLAYLEHAELDAQGVTWFEARRDALLREADALDPPAPVAEPAAEIEAEPPAPVLPPPPRRDVDVHGRSAALLSTGVVASAAAVGLAAASVRVEQRCQPSGPCSARWDPQPPLLAPAMVLAALGSTSVVLAVAGAPSLERRRVRVAVGSSTIALGSVAAVLGTITGALAGARWGGPISPSDDTSLGTTQALANASVASFTAALPLLGAGVTTWVRGRLEHRNARSRPMARR